ncbi:hypothetical protein ACIQWN_16170 [Streptomyces vinaceus]|uniref:hypothetical protein n=1 Tax=Streptomyces vinaceus TaxID=1960 RepID=UPI003827FA77
MLRRRAALPLPLILAAVALTAGCVTVRPDRPAEAARTTPAAEPGAVVEALPLGRLPEPPPPSEPPEPEPDPDASGPAPESRPAPPRAAERAPARPARPARPAPAPGPRRHPPARQNPAPAQPRPYDMTALCEAAKGTVHPSIVALCR